MGRQDACSDLTDTNTLPLYPSTKVLLTYRVSQAQRQRTPLLSASTPSNPPRPKMLHHPHATIDLHSTRFRNKKHNDHCPHRLPSRPRPRVRHPKSQEPTSNRGRDGIGRFPSQSATAASVQVPVKDTFTSKAAASMTTLLRWHSYQLTPAEKRC